MVAIYLLSQINHLKAVRGEHLTTKLKEAPHRYPITRLREQNITLNDANNQSSNHRYHCEQHTICTIRVKLIPANLRSTPHHLLSRTMMNALQDAWCGSLHSYTLLLQSSRTLQYRVLTNQIRTEDFVIPTKP
ncbi:hypothetical protein V6N11_068512 [Hibiscus sabdariffa]|uniref:Uncharacterized protein n=1 Tax=Hibiscus sabdariffa TaxID=183260 RepID=A0ABR2PAP8_9ROSI